MDTDAIDAVLSAGVTKAADGTLKLPGVVFMVADVKRNLFHTSAQGLRTLDPTHSPQEITPDSTCAIYSMTKLMTCISAMQCVERGLIRLDDDIGDVLPNWKHPDILEGFGEDGKPILRKAKNKITLRLLLCHSSGIGYDIYPDMIPWRVSRGEAPKTFVGSIDDGYTIPLAFEPGEGFIYGAGCDIAGRLVETLTSMRLGEYMEKNIWTPLGMTSTTFRINDPKSSDIKSRMVDMTARIESGQLVPIPEGPYSRDAPDDCGGIGLYSSAPDYMKVLLSITKDDGKLLKSETIDEMFKPQTPDSKYLEAQLNNPAMRPGLAGPVPEGVKFDYGLAGTINTEPVPGMRAEGSMQWGGMPNLLWFVDRKSGICATYFTQLMPNADVVATQMAQDLEKAIYAGIK